MARSSKSTVQLALSISWAGVILSALILIYLPHGPARHPKLNAISILMMASLSCGALINAGCTRQIIVAHVILWAVALFSTVLIANTDFGVGLHPLTCPGIYLLLGAISLGILSKATINRPNQHAA